MKRVYVNCLCIQLATVLSYCHTDSELGTGWQCEAHARLSDNSPSSHEETVGTSHGLNLLLATVPKVHFSPRLSSSSPSPAL